MNGLCPYCRTRPNTTDDHIFPEFLGGTKTIRACKECNDRFGHTFEAAISNDLSPIIVMLAFSGYKHKRIVVFKRAWIDEATGIEYDVDSERQSYPHKIYVDKENGQINRIIARNEAEGRKILKSLEKTGHKYQATFNLKEGLQPPIRNIQLNLGVEMRQLAVKQCIALGQLLSPGVDLVDTACRQFLLSKSPTASPVRLVCGRYKTLDALRPPLAHTIYVEARNKPSRSYGIVQLFGGAFYFYVPLSNEYKGQDFAGIGTLDITTFKEEFANTMGLHLIEAPRSISKDAYENYLLQWGGEINKQIEDTFGRVGIYLGRTLT